MNISDFDIYKDLLKENSGLSITQEKSYLVESRLKPIAKKWGYTDINAMTAILRGMPSKDLVTDIIEAMTTNETSFFRDTNPFEIFKNVTLPYYTKSNKANKKLRIWCAASSSGQEPYSLAMTLKEEAVKMPGWKFEIVGTDISHEIIDQAKEGSYSQFEVQRGLPVTHLMRYFTQTGEKWTINQEIRDMVQYKYFNLLDDMSSLGKFDIIFCRNVLIYFDKPTKQIVMERMGKQMEEDGFLVLGGAETVLGVTELFKGVTGSRGLYAKSDSLHTKAA